MGRALMNAQLISPALAFAPAPTSSASQPQPLPQEVNQLPPLAVVMTPAYDRLWKIFWPFFGTIGYTLSVSGFFSIPWEEYKLFLLFIVPFMMALVLPVHIILFYYSRVSHHMPSKPVGSYEKHGFELGYLIYAVLLQWFDPDFKHRTMGLTFVTGFNMFVHTMFQIRRNPPNLDWWDFSLIQVMQVTVFACGENKYAISAAFVACLMVIGYRFYFYSCPETSDAPVSIVQKFGTEKAC